jgi:hypothetical protein
MDYFVYNIDEYQPLEQGNEFAPKWPFRMVVSGSSDSGKTTMIMNLLMGNKKAKEDGERYILCNDVVLICRYLNEPKWKIVEDFYNELSELEDVSFKKILPSDIPDTEDFDSERSTVVVFEDPMNLPKKIQERIYEYFSGGRHNNISPIYVSQRFFAIPKTIRDNITYISLHIGGGSLSDIKRILRQYTEHSDALAPIIDDFTLKREFIIFDLRRSKNDPLSIRVRWDTALRSISDQSQINLSSISDIFSKFSSYGQKVILEAKKNNTLINFAKNMPLPIERKLLLADGIKVKNSDIWAKYVFREAFGIENKDLGSDWIKFSAQLKGPDIIPPTISKKSQLLRYKELLEMDPLNDKKIIEGCEILLWLFSNKHIDQKTFSMEIKELLSS